MHQLSKNTPHVCPMTASPTHTGQFVMRLDVTSCLACPQGAPRVWTNLGLGAVGVSAEVEEVPALLQAQ